MSYPEYSSAIIHAIITTLKDPRDGGCSLSCIKKVVSEQQQHLQGKKFNDRCFLLALRKSVATGELVLSNGTYKIGPTLVVAPSSHHVVNGKNKCTPVVAAAAAAKPKVAVENNNKNNNKNNKKKTKTMTKTKAVGNKKDAKPDIAIVALDKNKRKVTTATSKHVDNKKTKKQKTVAKLVAKYSSVGAKKTKTKKDAKVKTLPPKTNKGTNPFHGKKKKATHIKSKPLTAGKALAQAEKLSRHKKV